MAKSFGTKPRVLEWKVLGKLYCRYSGCAVQLRLGMPLALPRDPGGGQGLEQEVRKDFRLAASDEDLLVREVHGVYFTFWHLLCKVALRKL